MRRKKIWLLIAALPAVLVAAAVFWANRHPEIAPVAPPGEGAFDTALLRNGEALAGIGACAVCHTADRGASFAGGLALPTPFGVVYSTNITPDADSGIGSWPEAAFRRAMREGVDRRGRHLYPAFPYDHFTRVTDEDIHAIYAYLMAQEPVAFAAPENELRFPFNIRMLLAGWKLLFLETGEFEADPNRDEEWNRGAYLAEGVGHCGACHTPRNVFGAVSRELAFGGGEAEDWHVPALNADSPAPVPWSQLQLVNYLFDGWDAEHGIAAGPMAPVVNHLYDQSEDDVFAMAAYIESWQRPKLSDAERESVLPVRGRSTGQGTRIPPDQFRTTRPFSADWRSLATCARIATSRVRAVARAPRFDGNGKRAGSAQRHSDRLRRDPSASRCDPAVHAWFRSIDLGRRSRGHAEIPSLALQRPAAMGGILTHTSRPSGGLVGNGRPHGSRCVEGGG